MTTASCVPSTSATALRTLASVDALTTSVKVADVDGDGFRPVTGATTFSSDLFCDGEGEALPSMFPTDCDDFEASVRPDAAEVIGDGIDSASDGMKL